ncbi:MAG TPA: hypothetical protein VG410_11090 [Solirubrobacteraceae bacterium]|nr:hypothetical protein [Solirubrobacteraceae bacterium]
MTTSTVPDAAPPVSRKRGSLAAVGIDRFGGWIAALLALAGAAWALRLWRADLGVPFHYSSYSDVTFYVSLVKGIIDHGWFFTNHSLGAPFGQQLYDFPQSADNLNLLAIKVLGVFWGAPTVVNLFLLASFPVDAAVAYAVMRRLGVSAVPAVVSSVLFALLPYHFFRGDEHLFLSAYYALPVVAYLFISLLTGKSLFARRAPPHRRLVRWATARTGWTVLLCVVVASGGLYYAVFGIVMMVAGTLLAWLGRRGRAAVASGAVICGAIAAVLAINLAPTFVYQLSHGGNPVVAHTAGTGDDLAMSASYLVLPPLHDRIAPLRNVTEHYASSTPPHIYCEQCYESLGGIGDVGFVWLLVIGFAGIVGAPLVVRRAGVLRAAAAGVVVCLAVGITGGLSSLARVFVSSDIRAWNRMSVLIAFLSLFALAVLLEAIAAKLNRRPRGRVLFGALTVALLGFGLADQTGSYFVPPYKQDARQFASDSAFMTAVQRQLPPSASVFNLPYVPFPEGYQPFSSPGQTIPATRSLAFEYDEARLYVNSTGLSWSYGAIKGRPADWESQLAAKPAGLAVIGAATAGFRGVALDDLGYPGALGPEVRAGLERELGVVPLTSRERDVTFYDLRPLAARLRARYSPAQLSALRAAVLKPLALQCVARRLTVVNPDRVTHTATLTATVTGGVLVRVGAGGARSAAPGPLRLALTLPPGKTTIALSAPAGAPSGSLFAPTVTDSAFAPFSAAATTSVRAGIIGPPCASVAA